MSNEIISSSFDTPEQGEEEYKIETELEQSIEKIWDDLDIRTQTLRTKEEIKQLPLEELLPDPTVTAEFWTEIPQNVNEKIREVYRRRVERGILTPPKIGKVLRVIDLVPKQVWESEEKRELFLTTLEGYVEERTHPRRHLAIDRYLENYFYDRPFTLVDIGCSKGLITERLSRKFPNARVIGMDIFFPPNFELTNKKAEYIKADLLAKHLPISRIDCFICTSVWEHLAPEAAKQTLRSMAQNLNENGLIIEGIVELKDGRSGYIVLQKSKDKLKLINFIPYVESRKHG